MPQIKTRFRFKPAFAAAVQSAALAALILAGAGAFSLAAAAKAGGSIQAPAQPQALFGETPFPASAQPAAGGAKNIFAYAPEGGFIRISFARITAPAPQSGAKPKTAPAKSGSGRQAGAPAESGDFYGLVELDLKPGWKTYWRNPGTSGFGPQIRLDGGASGEFLYPAPQLFKDGGDWTYGYKHHVALPFCLSLPQPRRAVYTGNITLGICEKLCLPQNLAFHFSDPDSAPAGGQAGSAEDKSAEQTLRAALAALPQPAGRDFGLIRAKAGQSGAELQLIYPRKAPAPQLFIDGGEAQLGLPQPRGKKALRPGQSGKAAAATQTYFVPLLFGELKPGAELHYTVTAGGRSVSGVIKIQP